MNSTTPTFNWLAPVVVIAPLLAGEPQDQAPKQANSSDPAIQFADKLEYAGLIPTSWETASAAGAMGGRSWSHSTYGRLTIQALPFPVESYIDLLPASLEILGPVSDVSTAGCDFAKEICYMQSGDAPKSGWSRALGLGPTLTLIHTVSQGRNEQATDFEQRWEAARTQVRIVGIGVFNLRFQEKLEQSGAQLGVNSIALPGIELGLPVPEGWKASTPTARAVAQFESEGGERVGLLLDIDDKASDDVQAERFLLGDPVVARSAKQPPQGTLSALDFVVFTEGAASFDSRRVMIFRHDGIVYGLVGSKTSKLPSNSSDGKQAQPAWQELSRPLQKAMASWKPKLTKKK